MRAASHAADLGHLFDRTGKSSPFPSIGEDNLSDARTEDSTGCSGHSTERSENGGAPIATTDRYSLPHRNDKRKSPICAFSPLPRLRVVQ